MNQYIFTTQERADNFCAMLRRFRGANLKSLILSGSFVVKVPEELDELAKVYMDGFQDGFSHNYCGD